MVKPSVAELTNNGAFNRYILAVGTAKVAREITDEYNRQREVAEKNKENDKNAINSISKEYRDDKAVKIAVRKLHNKDYVIKGYTDGTLETEEQ